MKPDCVNKINLGSGIGASNWLTGISHREYGEARRVDRETHREKKNGRDLEVFLVWDSWRDVPLLGLWPKREVNWLLLGF